MWSCEKSNNGTNSRIVDAPCDELLLLPLCVDNCSE
jgi:hypothetical protein